MTAHIIKNFETLASSPMRRAALSIAEAGYSAINTTKAVNAAVSYSSFFNTLSVGSQKFSLKKYRRVRLLGIGKASLEAAGALKQILGNRLSDGYVIDVKAGDLGKNIISRAGTHPLASDINREYTQQLLARFEHGSEADLVICIVSGGGSALLCAPYGQSPQEEAEVFKILTAQGATIFEINTVRKHTSQVKGGFLAQALYPATVAALVFSDVPGDELGMVASGPLVLDSTKVSDASAILGKYQVLEKLQRAKIGLQETPKDPKYFARIHNFLLVSGQAALAAMRARAEDLGFEARNFSEQFQGEARVLGLEIAGSAKKGECLLGIGESTVTLKGKGLGGRNQEMALGALPALAAGMVLGCFASDGHDNTEAAGALADASTAQRAEKLGLKPETFLSHNDSFRFFEATGDLVYTGLTGSNVADFFICLKR